MVTMAIGQTIALIRRANLLPFFIAAAPVNHRRFGPRRRALCARE